MAFLDELTSLKNSLFGEDTSWQEVLAGGSGIAALLASLTGKSQDQVAKTVQEQAQSATSESQTSGTSDVTITGSHPRPPKHKRVRLRRLHPALRPALRHSSRLGLRQGLRSKHLPAPLSSRARQPARPADRRGGRLDSRSCPMPLDSFRGIRRTLTVTAL